MLVPKEPVRIGIIAIQRILGGNPQHTVLIGNHSNQIVTGYRGGVGTHMTEYLKIVTIIPR
jgi:hypothetical protein